MTRKLLSPQGANLVFELGASANLNDCVAPGLYHQASNVEAAGGTNYPTPYAGYLEVVVDASNTFAYQRYHTYRLYNTMWYRSAQWNTPTGGVWNWSAWRQVPTSTNLVVDYLNVDSGYTLTGASGSAAGNPGATANGAINVEDHLKFFVNTDAPTESGYGDYDADIWMKDNGYLMAESSIHLRPTNTGSMGSYTEQGRVVFKSKVLPTTGAVNLIQSGRNFSGTTKNDLAITEYMPDGTLDNNYWAYFDESTGGKLGLGINGDGSNAPSVDYRLYVKDDVGTTTPVSRIENAGSAYSLLDFKGSTTSTAVQIGANANALIGRIGTSEVLTVSSGGITVNGSISGNVAAGGADFVCVSDASGYLSTSGTISTTELGYLNNATSNIQTQLDARKVPLYYMITGSNVTLFSGLTGTSTASVFGTTGTNLAVGSYLVEGAVYIESATDASTTGTHSIFFGSSSGTAVPSETSMYLSYNSSTTAVGNAAALSGVRRLGTTTFPSLTLTAIAAAATNVSKMQINSIVRIGTAGNFTVRYTATASGAGTINSVALPGSYLKITPISTQTATTVGTWA